MDTSSTTEVTFHLIYETMPREHLFTFQNYVGSQPLWASPHLQLKDKAYLAVMSEDEMR